MKDMSHEVNVRFLGLDKTKPLDGVKSYQLEKLASIIRRLDENHDKLNLANIGILLTALDVSLSCHNIDLVVILSEANHSTVLVGLGVKVGEGEPDFSTRFTSVSSSVLGRLSEEALPLG